MLNSQASTIPSQFFSSELSWQFASPLHRKMLSMHCPLSHWNWESEQTGQFFSSLWSSHSVNPSQRQATGMQSISPVKQVNCWGEHVGGSFKKRKQKQTQRNTSIIHVYKQHILKERGGRTQLFDKHTPCKVFFPLSDWCSSELHMPECRLM